jgi:L-serine deaminase
MKTVSIFNHVFGPVMRGPSSSHTAGAFHIGSMARSILGGLHTRAAARALTVMHVDGAMGVICTAPTGGSAGVIPGTLVTLAEEQALTREQIALALLAAGAIGMIVAIRETFAAEVAGCQVEIGASGAMAAAAVMDAAGFAPESTGTTDRLRSPPYGRTSESSPALHRRLSGFSVYASVYEWPAP